MWEEVLGGRVWAVMLWIGGRRCWVANVESGDVWTEELDGRVWAAVFGSWEGGAWGM